MQYALSKPRVSTWFEYPETNQLKPMAMLHTQHTSRENFQTSINAQHSPYTSYCMWVTQCIWVIFWLLLCSLWGTHWGRRNSWVFSMVAIIIRHILCEVCAEVEKNRSTMCCSIYCLELCCSMYCFCQLCCSMYCLFVNVYCTTATECLPNHSSIYIIYIET